MNIYPAIDLKSGRCVRLHQGCFERVTSYHDDPLIVAKSFENQGASFLHVVDLDGARNSYPMQSDLIYQLAHETQLQIQVGGGIRTKGQISNLLKFGVSRVILGSVAVFQPKIVKEWIKEFPNKIVLALDVRSDENSEPQLSSQAWQKNCALSLWKLLENYSELESIPILCTDIDRDGTLQGPNFDLYKECLRRFPSFRFQASGGIHSLGDLKKLSQMKITDAIIGKALYENKFTLTQAITEVRPC